MFFSLLPDVRQLAVSEFLRARAAALRGAAPGQAPITVHRPAASRFLLAGICALLLWQPLKGEPSTVAAPEPTPLATAAPVDPAAALVAETTR